MFIDSLEPRQLLSAAHPAAKAPAIIPNIVGIYSGTGVNTKTQQTENVTFDISGQTTKGVLSGTASEGGSVTTYPLRGKVTSKDKVTFKVNSGHKVVISAHGTYSIQNGSISGKFSAGKFHGTFTLNLET